MKPRAFRAWPDFRHHDHALSEVYAGVDSLLRALDEGWIIYGWTRKEEFCRNTARRVVVYRFILKRDEAEMSMAVVVKPYINPLLIALGSKPLVEEDISSNLSRPYFNPVVPLTPPANDGFAKAENHYHIADVTLPVTGQRLSIDLLTGSGSPIQAVNPSLTQPSNIFLGAPTIIPSIMAKISNRLYEFNSEMSKRINRLLSGDKPLKISDRKRMVEAIGEDCASVVRLWKN
jgi:hypothetical protein